MSELRICSSCSRMRLESEFYSNGKCRHTSCKECARKKAKQWRLDNPELAKAKDAEKHARRRQAAIEHMKAYDALNLEAKRERMRRRYASNVEVMREKTRSYRKQNPGKVLAANNLRRAIEKRAMPTWADKSLISSLYELARIYSQSLGQAFHVDHVVPLRGEIVCGLHVQDNLQIITSGENLKKGRSFHV